MATKTKTRQGQRSTRPRDDRPKRPRDRTPGRLAAVQKLARDSFAEMKKITWPDRDTTRNLTLFVIALSVLLGVILGGVDAVFVKLWSVL